MSVNKNCTLTWTFVKGNVKLSFKSEKDLNTYLQNNYLSDIKKKSDRVFEKTNVTSKTFDVLSSANKAARERLDVSRNMAADAVRRREMNRVEDIETKFVDDTPAEAYSDNFLPVSEYVFNMGELNRIDMDKYIISRKEELANNPSVEDKRKIAEVIRKYNLTTDEEVIDKIIEEENILRKAIRKAGKALDKIFGIVINKNNQYHKYYLDTEGNFNIQQFIDDNAEWKNANGESWYDLEGMYTDEVQADGTVKKVSPLLQSFIRQIQLLKDNQLNLRYTDKVIYQYTADYSTGNDTGIRGKMDIVVIRQGGRVDIYDIKTSSKAARDLVPGSSEWDKDKVKATEYQLAFYGRMMLNLGIEASKITLNVIPILINQDGITTKSIVLNTPVKVIPKKEVDQFVRDVIPIELKASVEADTMRNDLVSTLEKMFPTILINNLILNVHDKYFTETKKIRKEGNKYRFERHLKNTFDVVYSDSLEEATEKYKAYLKIKQEDSNSWFSSIKSNLRAALEDFGKSKVDIFETLFANKLPSNILLNFKKYFTDEGWEIAQLSEDVEAVLDGLNTMVLYNPKTGVHDIIALSSLDFDRNVLLTKGTTIFGTFNTDDLAKTKKNVRKSTVGNILLMRNMAVANMLAKYLPQMDFVFGDISVFSSRRDSDTSYGKYWSLPSSELIEDSRRLHGLAGIKSEIQENNIASIDIQILNLFEQVMRANNESEFQALPGALLTGATSTRLKGFFKDIDSLLNRQDRLKKLELLWKLLTEVNSSKNISLDQLNQSRTMNGYIYREVARLFALNSDMFMDLYNMDIMSKYGIENFIQAAKQRTILNGSYTKTIDTIPIVATVHSAIQKVNQLVRDDLTNYKDNENRAMFKLAGLDSNLDMAHNKKFYDLSENGKKFFLLKNPDTDSTLTPDEKKFLDWYLKKLNTLREGHPLSDSDIHELRLSGRYFEAALCRTSTYSRLANANKKSAKEVYQDAKSSIFNLRNAVIGQEEYFENGGDYRDMVELYNTFRSSDSAREELIAQANGDNFAFFEASLEEVLDSFACAESKSKRFNAILPPISAAVASLQALGYASGVDIDEAYDFINKHLKSAIFNESLLPQDEIIKAVLTIKSYTGGIILGFNLLSGTKEVFNGIFMHYSRAVANKLGGDKDKIGVLDMTKAYGTVWKDALTLFKTYTKQEKLNVKFGMANMDIDAITQNQNYYKTDPLRFKYFLYWTNRAPDFLNRMTVLTGYMYKYGCYDAYTVNEDTGKLEYDWRKDERFNLLAKNDRSNLTAFYEQRALYSVMMQDLVEQGYEYTDPKTGIKRPLVWDPNNFESKDNDELMEGFTNKQIKAIKEESDRAFGYMDHDTTSMIFKAGITAIFFQFKRFASAKLSQWLLNPDINDLGYYKLAKDAVTGELLYRRTFQLEDGSWDCEFVTTQFGEFEGKKVEYEPVKEWIGSPMEGIVWSTLDLLNLFKPENMKKYWFNPEYAYKRANMLAGLQDILGLLLIKWLIQAMYPDGKPNDVDSFFERNVMVALNNSGQDMNPITTILKGNLTLDFAAVDFWDRMGPEVWKAISSNVTGEGNGSFYKVISRAGAMAPFRKNLKDLAAESVAERK